jgi:hypothetical protein
MSLAIQNRGQESETEAMRILRSVSDEEAFYFYEAIGKPTGQSARCLSDFLEKIRLVKLESLLLHLQRRDFQIWIEWTLGDSKLARRIGRIRPLHNDDLRLKICATIENRIEELRGKGFNTVLFETLEADKREPLLEEVHESMPVHVETEGGQSDDSIVIDVAAVKNMVSGTCVLKPDFVVCKEGKTIRIFRIVEESPRTYDQALNDVPVKLLVRRLRAELRENRKGET